VAEPLHVASCTPPGRQAVLLHVSSRKAHRYVVIGREGVELGSESATHRFVARYARLTN
jgi:hypothetical protein